MGGRFVVNDSGETPNTMLAVLEYPTVPLVYEQRNLPIRPGAKEMDQCFGLRTGAIVYCEGGVVAGLAGANAFDPAGKVIRTFRGTGGKTEHMRNFLDVMRSRKFGELAAPASFGHVTASACHFGSISYRAGGTGSSNAAAEAVTSVPPAEQIFRELERHLSAHGVPTTGNACTIGQRLAIDEIGDDFVVADGQSRDDLSEARALLRDAARPRYEFPEP
jgi:hypothetical protein